jgi:hypothetical protein
MQHEYTVCPHHKTGGVGKRYLHCCRSPWFTHRGRHASKLLSSRTLRFDFMDASPHTFDFSTSNAHSRSAALPVPGAVVVGDPCELKKKNGHNYPRGFVGGL